MFRLNLMVRILALMAAVTAPVAGHSQSRVYSGAEAQALRCAAYFTLTTYMLEQRGLLTFENRQEGALHATAILGRHVGGTYEQKFQAFQTMLRRLPAEDNQLISESLTHLSWCSDRFLG